MVTIAEMKELEKRADAAGFSYQQMMERAGQKLAERICAIWPEASRILLFCGKGNNGGDGLIAARYLKEAGKEPAIILIDGMVVTEEAHINLRSAGQSGVPILWLAEFGEKLERLVPAADLLVDAIYGTGFHGQLKEECQKWTKIINASEKPIVAADIPSGINGDTGEFDANCIKADNTFAFHDYKPAHTMPACSEYMGIIECVDIGITEALQNAAE